MSITGYKPFPITEQKTGMFDYTQPWIRPQDAWEPLENAYIYRGVLNKRDGYVEFGRMVYRDNGTQIALGKGIAAYSDASAGAIIIPTLPIRPGSLVIVAQSVAGPLLTATDNGLGQFVGDVVGPPSGAIDYNLGTWSLTFNANVLAGSSIRAGYTFIPSQTTTPLPITNRPIMGLKTWSNEATDSVLFLAMDTRRASVYNVGANRFDPISGVSQVVWVGDGATVAININTGWTNLAPFSVRITDGTTTVRDNGLGVIVSLGGGAIPPPDGNFNGGTVNYAAGTITINFLVAPVANANITATFSLTGDYFTGDYTKFFNATNWNTYLYLTNNTDRITRFNGTTLDRPPFAITLANYRALVNDITTCLDIDVYKNRLLVQRPTTNTVLEPQSIRFSATNNPLNLAADVTGNGGELSAPTDDFLQASEFLRDQLIVWFTNTVFIFRFTGSPFEPFRFDKLNVTKSCNSPYGTVAYDDRVTAIGKKGLVYCDGTNVARYDNAIIDQYLDINQTDFNLCFSLRHDTFNQTFTLYPSAGQSTTSTVVSDKILVYNFLENTWATYLLPLSCLGLFRTTSDARWIDFAPGGKYFLMGYTDWSLCDFSWDFWFTQSDALSVMGGGHDGIIWQMNIGEFDRDPPGLTIDVNCTSTRWNPFVKDGQKAQFGWLDIYYQKDDDTTLNLTFFTDNSEAPTVTKTCRLDGPANVDAAFKRIYLNITGEFLQMNITSANSGFAINGFILWAKPAGRIFP